jgi:hypothetical protein
MSSNPFAPLIGLRLSIVRRAADMLVAHFGDIRPHSSGEGTVGDYAFHVQCPWRFDGPVDTVTGRDRPVGICRTGRAPGALVLRGRRERAG